MLADESEVGEIVRVDARSIEHGFICNICGIRSPQPILCTRDGCPTALTVHGIAVSTRRH